MSKIVNLEPCWVVRDHEDQPWADDYDTHHATREDAQADIEAIRDDYADDETPDEIAARLGGVDGASVQVECARRQAARLAALHAVALSDVCYRVVCDKCWKEPESDEGPLHFGSHGQFDADDWEWSMTGDLHFCDKCKRNVLCVDCGDLSNDLSLGKDGLCLDCRGKTTRDPVQSPAQAVDTPAPSESAAVLFRRAADRLDDLHNRAWDGPDLYDAIGNVDLTAEDLARVMLPTVPPLLAGILRDMADLVDMGHVGYLPRVEPVVALAQAVLRESTGGEPE